MKIYIDQLNKSNCETSLIYWDRDSMPDVTISSAVKLYCFKKNLLDSEPILKKIPSFVEYRNFSKEIITKNHFDIIIVLHTTPGVLLSDILTKNYRGRYIIDYRDFTYENLSFYRRIIHCLINNSLMTFVSSKGYLRYLPHSSNIYISHNLLLHSKEERNVRNNSPRENYPIRVRFWGFIRHTQININIIDRIGNDSRFELHYHGREQETGKQLRTYVKKKNIKNVYFHGEYKPFDRVVFASKTEMIHNIYENDVKTTYAMGNKFYDGLSFYLPQMCNKGSFMGQETESNGVGIMLDPLDPDFADTLYRYYKTVNWETFFTKCDDKLSIIINEYNVGSDHLNKILTGK